jgi:hypothetical protein
MAMKDYIICGLLIAVGFGAAHVRASTDPQLKRVELLATIGSFGAAAGSAFLLAHPSWWPFSAGRLILALLAPLWVALLTWAVGEGALRWSRHPVLGLLGAVGGIMLAVFACGRFSPGPANAILLFAPVMAGAFGGYQVASGGRRLISPSKS